MDTSKYYADKRWMTAEVVINVTDGDTLLMHYASKVGGGHDKDVKDAVQQRNACLKGIVGKVVETIGTTEGEPAKIGYVRVYAVGGSKSIKVHIAPLVATTQHDFSGYPIDKLPKWATVKANVSSAVASEDF